jgi:hypothetical protein
MLVIAVSALVFGVIIAAFLGTLEVDRRTQQPNLTPHRRRHDDAERRLEAALDTDHRWRATDRR